MRGNHDPVNLIFTDEDGNATKIVEVKRNGKKIVNIVINGGERTPQLSEADFIPYDQQYKFYSEKQTAEVNEEALKLDLHNAIKFYKEHADLETSDAFHDMVAAKMTDEGIVNVLKAREGEAKIYFVE